MFTNRVFNFMFSVSLIWHVFWMSALRITIPENLKLVETTKVSFLGPILDKTALDVFMESRPKIMDTGYRISKMSVAEVASLEPPSVESKYYTGIVSVKSADTFKISLRRLLSGTKKTPNYYPEVSQKTDGRDNFAKEQNIPIEGPAGKRALLYRPEFPELPSLVDAGGESFSVRIKFSVLPGGKVAKAQPVASSGYPDIDLLGIRYVNKWEFEPKPGAGQEDWGVVDIEFEAPGK
jgi:TonB family protein